MQNQLARFQAAFKATAYSLALGSTIYLFTSNCCTVSAVKGASMLPTFNSEGDFVFVDLLLWKYKALELGSVMVYTSPTEPDKLVVKRLLGLPGDVVCIDPSVSTTERIRVPEGHVWMIGDNCAASNDSRHYGPVPIGLLRGKIVSRVASFGKW